MAQFKISKIINQLVWADEKLIYILLKNSHFQWKGGTVFLTVPTSEPTKRDCGEFITMFLSKLTLGQFSF